MDGRIDTKVDATACSNGSGRRQRDGFVDVAMEFGDCAECADRPACLGFGKLTLKQIGEVHSCYLA